jgi:hypothetical protein
MKSISPKRVRLPMMTPFEKSGFLLRILIDQLGLVDPGVDIPIDIGFVFHGLPSSFRKR